jgi:hypothetical protein
MKTYIGISLDYSLSMSKIAYAAGVDYNKLVQTIQFNSEETKIETIVTVVKCGVGHNGDNVIDILKTNVFDIKSIDPKKYIPTGHYTPLLDSVGLLIEQLSAVSDFYDPKVNFLINVITDGEDNSSHKWRNKLGDKIRELQSSDKWTFTFRVPRGHTNRLTCFGIPQGNILEWDQTDDGVMESSDITSQGMRSFFMGTKRGKTSTSSFYSTDMSNVSAKKIKTVLVDISNEVQIWDVTNSDDKKQIRVFCEEHLNQPMKRGSAFYLLMKPEDEVQDYKQIVIRNKKTKAIYSGANARQILGLPYSGTVKVVPGNHGEFDIFIQSTSVNRKLVRGTQVLYWDKVGQEYLSNKSFPGPIPVKQTPVKQTPPTTSSPSNVSQEYIWGYSGGFFDGKNKNAKLIFQIINEFANGYNAGYRDGRGKKKRLYK